MTKILDCTLRDGSYAINFQFTENETKEIVSGLERIGVKYIEVGHGIGLGASEKDQVAAESDETYLKATAETVKTAMWGMFCIPGIAGLEHIDLAADYGMKFIRIGTSFSKLDKARPFITKAKRKGMFVCCNFMKSYTAKPTIFANHVLEAESYGSDIVYLVDSAGSMLPEDIESYFSAVRACSSSIKLGFHGHNNLGMGVANALKAHELGFEIIDTSLQGLGRSAGNTPTEQFLCALIRRGVGMNIDPIAVMDLGEKFIQPLIKTRGFSSIDIISGLSRFHSSYMPIIEKFATKYRVDPRRLILAVCQKDCLEAPEQLVDSQAKELHNKQSHGSWKYLYQAYHGNEQSCNYI